MANSNDRNRITLMAVAVAVLMGLAQVQAQAQAQAQCHGLDITGLMTQCRRYVVKLGPKIPPSPNCCGVLRNVDLACACKYVSKDFERLVSVEKAVYVARQCGLAIKTGFKCGSYTAPPPNAEMPDMP